MTPELRVVFRADARPLAEAMDRNRLAFDIAAGRAAANSIGRFLRLGAPPAWLQPPRSVA
jgi:hypothetical protein